MNTRLAFWTVSSFVLVRVRFGIYLKRATKWEERQYVPISNRPTTGFSHEKTTHHFELNYDGGVTSAPTMSKTPKVATRFEVTSSTLPSCSPPGISTRRCTRRHRFRHRHHDSVERSTALGSEGHPPAGRESTSWPTTRPRWMRFMSFSDSRLKITRRAMAPWFANADILELDRCVEP